MSMSQAERDAEDAKWEKERPMREWKREMVEADKNITARDVENIFNALESSVKDRVDEETKSKFANRGQIRSRKPKNRRA